METKAALQSEIEKITLNTIPMHMPGHKRALMPSDRLPYDLDITEISGADDLHCANGILKEAMQRASDLWGSRRTWFLVGGSTCGILAAIRAAAPFGSEIIVARNCHRSVYHAIELGGYRVHWISPEQIQRYRISGQIRPDKVRSMLLRHPASAAVILTSPTYEGIVSDVKAIAGICHSAGIPLVVDEAHGAHFGLFEEGGFPDSAVHLGADIVVQSVHKTLPSLTQTALLHLQGDLVEEKEIERQLGIFETSSPSYPLMISIDSCVDLLAREGTALFGEWKRNLDEFYRCAEELEYIAVWGANTREARRKEAPLRDFSKILISFARAGMKGSEAAQILREKYGIETEMCSGYNVLAMTGCGDSEEHFRALSDALRDIDEKLREDPETRSAEREPIRIPAVRTACRIFDAVNSCREDMPLVSSQGRICGEYLYAYPPGIPILAPGEYVSEDHLKLIRQMEADGNPVHHSYSDDGRVIVCLAE